MGIAASPRILTLGGVIFLLLFHVTESQAETFRFEAIQLARFAVDTKRRTLTDAVKGADYAGWTRSL